MKLRSMILTVLAFFTLMSAALVQAQDDTGIDMCFGLSEADCTVINEASANGIGDATSFTLDISVDFSGTELETVFAMFAMFGGGEMDLGPLSSINAATFTLDGTFDVYMDAETETGTIAGSFTTSFSEDGGEVTEVAGDIVLTEDFLYLNEGDGWQSIDLARLSESEAAAGLTDMVSGFGMDMGMGGEEMPEEAADADTGMLSAMSALLEVPGFVTYVRTGDDFAFNVDFLALQLLLTDEYAEQYTELINTASAVDPMMSFMIPSLLVIFQEGSISIVQSVDTEANIVTAFDVDINLAISPALITGEQTLSEIALAADLAISNLNGVSMAEIPADAVDGTDDFIAMLEEMMPAMEAEATEEASDG